MDHVAIKKRIVAGFAWTAGTKLLVQIAAWASTIVVARILTPSDYGILAIATAVTGFLDMVMELGLAQGLIHESRTTRAQEDGVFYISVALGVLTYLVVLALAPVLASFYSMPLLESLLPVLGLSLILSSLKVVPLALAMQRLDFRYRSLVEMSATILSVVSVYSLAVLGYGAWSIVAGLIVLQLVSAIAYLPLLDHVPRPQFDLREMGRILRFGGSTMASRLMFYFYSRTDVFVAGRYVGEKVLGFYSMAYTLAEIPLEKIGTIFHKVAFPAIAKIKSDTAQTRTYFLAMHRYLLIIAYPLLVGVALLSEDIVLLLFTEKWLPIVPFLQIFCVINLVKVSGMLMPPILLGRGRTDLIFRYSAMSAALIVVAVVIGIQYGILAMAYAVALANLPPYLYIVTALLRELGARPAEFVSSFTSAVVASTVMALGVGAVHWILVAEPGWGRLVLSVALGGALYLGIFALFYRDQLRQVWSGLRLLRGGTTAAGEAAP